ncbi:hypothetical protein ACVINZ_001605 [Mesorhizobium jarvisii]
MSDDDDDDALQRELDALQRQLEAAPPIAVESDAARRARALARDKQIREFVKAAANALRERKA